MDARRLSSGLAIIPSPPGAMVDQIPLRRRVSMTVLLAIVLTVFPALVIVAALMDLTSYTIPNRISLGLVAAFAPACLLAGLPLTTVGICLAVGAAALVAGMVMFALGWIGGGDAKLFAAAALWLGFAPMPTFLLVTALCGGGLAVLLLNARSALVRPLLAGAPPWLDRLTTPGASVPYGVAIAAGALAAFPQCGLAHAL
jgi:prepilin peptidase CpaA